MYMCTSNKADLELQGVLISVVYQDSDLAELLLCYSQHDHPQ